MWQTVNDCLLFIYESIIFFHHTLFHGCDKEIIRQIMVLDFN